MSETRIEKLPLSTCIEMAHPRNPKDHDVDALIQSFRRFGFVAFPTIDERSQTMVAGHGRCEALARLKAAGERPPANIDEEANDWMVPVVRGISFKSDRERDAYVIADNQQVMAGGWHFDVLSEIITELKDDGGYAGLGFDLVEIDSLLGNYTPEMPDDGHDPESSTPTGDADGPRTQITAVVECPNCHHKFAR